MQQCREEDRGCRPPKGFPLHDAEEIKLKTFIFARNVIGTAGLVLFAYSINRDRSSTIGLHSPAVVRRSNVPGLLGVFSNR